VDIHNAIRQIQTQVEQHQHQEDWLLPAEQWLRDQWAKVSPWFSKLTHWLDHLFKQLLPKQTPLPAWLNDHTWIPLLKGLFWVGVVAVAGIVLWQLVQWLKRQWVSSNPSTTNFSASFETDTTTPLLSVRHYLQFAETAVGQQAYKTAIQAYYWASLALLSEKGWIQWQPHQTNGELRQWLDYRQQTSDNNSAPDMETMSEDWFKQIATPYERAWFGTETSTGPTVNQLKATLGTLQRLPLFKPNDANTDLPNDHKGPAQ